MKNKNFKLFLILIVLISFVGCGKKEENKSQESKVDVNNNDALIWEVKSDTATIYLVGSIHVANEDTYPLQQKLLDAFEQSEAIAVEADVTNIDDELMIQIQTMMMYTDGTTLKDHVSKETLTLFDEYVAENGISYFTEDHLEVLYLFKPWVLYSLLDSDIVMVAGFDSESGIDMHFINAAKDKEMEIIEVESIMSQYNMIDSFSPELQEYMLKDSLSTSRTDSSNSVKLMLSLWEKGDVAAFEHLLDEDNADLLGTMTDEEKKLYEEYNNKMIIDRNITMTDKVEELLKGDKDVFYIVGSAHMIGEQGIVKLLEERGYIVTKK